VSPRRTAFARSVGGEPSGCLIAARSAVRTCCRSNLEPVPRLVEVR
jgi:hypothetical protein